MTGTLELSESDITKSKVEVSVDAATINTGELQRDAHLKSADFLEMDKFPVLTFKSTSLSHKNAWGTGSSRQTYHSWCHLKCAPCSGTAKRAKTGSVGQDAHWTVCLDANQLKRLRPHLECVPRNWRHSGGDKVAIDLGIKFLK